jgi:hypothetical protein
MNYSLPQESMLTFLKLLKENSTNSALWLRIFQESINAANTIEALSGRVGEVIVQSKEMQLSDEALDTLCSFVTRFRSKNHSLQAAVHACEAQMEFTEFQTGCIVKSLNWLKERDEFYSQQILKMSKNDSVFAASGFRSSLIRDNQTWHAIREYCLVAQKI